MVEISTVWGSCRMELFDESSAELHGYTNSTGANTKRTCDIIMKYIKEEEVTALDGGLFQRGITACKNECADR